MAIKYCDSDMVLRKLLNKVRITEDPDSNPDLMSEELFQQLIEEAEALVELDLSPRYTSPFQTVDETPFAELPETTKMYLKSLCEMKAALHVMSFDFGAASSDDKYSQKLEKMYDKFKDRAMELRSGTYNTYKFPPLPGLMLNYHNHAADDGYNGEVLSTTRHDGAYAAAQINNPAHTFGYISDEESDLL